MTSHRKRFASRRGLLITLGVVIAVLGAGRIALPYILQDYVNQQLDEIPDYDGHVGDIDVHLLRGAYEIEDVELVKTSGKVEVPLFSAKKVDLSVEWGALFDGEFVGEIAFDEAKLNYVSGPTEEQSQTGVDDSWLDTVDGLFPLRFNKFAINDGQIHYRDFHSDPPVDVFIDSVYVIAKNLTNSKDVSDTLYAVVEVTGLAMKHAPVNLHLELDPFAEQQTFDLNASLRNLNLVELNGFIKAYGKIDFEKGSFDMDTELAASDGRIEGYVKPLFNDVKIVDWDENKSNPLKAVWEVVVAAVGTLFTNQSKDRIATTIPISGDIENPGTNPFSVIGGLLRNAFIRAFVPGIEGSVDLEATDSKEKNETEEEAREEVKEKQKDGD